MVRGWGRQKGSFSEVRCCVQTEDNRGLGLGNISWRNLALLGKWLWRYPREGLALWHQETGKEFDYGKICVLGPSRPFSWNLNFRRNLLDSEIEDLEGLMRSLDNLYLSPSVPDARLWPLSSSGLFSVKSFFLALSQSFGSPQNFPSKFVWNSQVPFKVKSFVWLFQLAKMDWVPPRSIYDMMSIKFKGFGNSKRGIVLWQAASIALIRVVWWERNARIFEDKARNSKFLWDSMFSLLPFGLSIPRHLRGFPLM
ncbi:hypothetical protein CK203_053800 [Vitis vinifera]|uniref:Uncharacterized protein n=1 Tax=Vitis vinifera TaxID=29760 RepID=A0A438GQN5_VITVI|nr:hypothetical protein CK203_053800 [Vitis vinifera]